MPGRPEGLMYFSLNVENNMAKKPAHSPDTLPLVSSGSHMTTLLPLLASMSPARPSRGQRTNTPLGAEVVAAPLLVTICIRAPEKAEKWVTGTRSDIVR